MTRKESNERLYYRCEKRSPGLKPVIGFIKKKSDIDVKERNRLYAEFLNGNITAKQRFIEYFMRNALQLAYLFSSRTGIELDELFSVAYEAIIYRIEKLTFDTEKKLYRHVCNYILRSLNKYVKNFNRSVSLNYISNWGYDGEKAIIEYLHDKNLVEYIDKTNILTMEERTIISASLNLSGYGKLSFEKIAEELHMSERRANYKYKKGVKKLAESDFFQELHKEAQPTATACSNNASAETVMKLQFCGIEFDLEEIRKAVEADCKAKSYAPITSLKIYVKPEDKAVYYVANNTITDKIDL